MEINALLERTEELLTDCDCDGSCYKCLRHYRNQNLHGQLERFFALDLLRWSRDGFLAPPLSLAKQSEHVHALRRILEAAGCALSTDGSTIYIMRNGIRKIIAVYPAMWAEPYGRGDIFISDAYMKYAKPYAVRKILDALKQA